MTDLTERLRNLDITRQFSGGQLPLIEEAADEIERLKDELDAERYDSMFKDKEIERLRGVEKKYRWLRSQASYEARHDENPPYAWTIRFRSTCSTPENAIKKAALEEADGV